MKFLGQLRLYKVRAQAATNKTESMMTAAFDLSGEGVGGLTPPPTG